MTDDIRIISYTVKVKNTPSIVASIIDYCTLKVVLILVAVFL